VPPDGRLLIVIVGLNVPPPSENPGSAGKPVNFPVDVLKVTVAVGLYVPPPIKLHGKLATLPDDGTAPHGLILVTNPVNVPPTMRGYAKSPTLKPVFLLFVTATLTVPVKVPPEIDAPTAAGTPVNETLPEKVPPVIENCSPPDTDPLYVPIVIVKLQ
jgi:hypothetical protein